MPQFHSQRYCHSFLMLVWRLRRGVPVQRNVRPTPGTDVRLAICQTMCPCKWNCQGELFPGGLVLETTLHSSIPGHCPFLVQQVADVAFLKEWLRAATCAFLDKSLERCKPWCARCWSHEWELLVTLYKICRPLRVGPIVHSSLIADGWLQTDRVVLNSLCCNCEQTEGSLGTQEWPPVGRWNFGWLRHLHFSRNTVPQTKDWEIACCKIRTTRWHEQCGRQPKKKERNVWDVTNSSKGRLRMAKMKIKWVLKNIQRCFCRGKFHMYLRTAILNGRIHILPEIEQEIRVLTTAQLGNRKY